MKKSNNNQIQKHFQKSRFSDFTYPELRTILIEFQLDWILASRILSGFMYCDLLKEEKEDIEQQIFEWIKEQILNGITPPYSLDFDRIWNLIMNDNELNPNKLNSEVLYNSLNNSKAINKNKREKHKTGYHINQGKHGNRKKK